MCQPPRGLPLQFIVTMLALATVGFERFGSWKLMFGSATRLTARICESSVMTSASAPPPPRPACLPAELQDCLACLCLKAAMLDGKAQPCGLFSHGGSLMV